MEWLDLELSAQTAFRLEQQRRELRSCDDPIVLLALAEGLLELSHNLATVNRQLIDLVGRMEAQAMATGVEDRHLRWAQELLADLPRS